MPENNQQNHAGDVVERGDPMRDPLDQTTCGVAIIDLDGHILQANQTLTDLVGYSPSELAGRSLSELTYAPDVNTDLADARRLLAGEITEYKAQKRYIRKDNSLACVKLTVSLSRDNVGQPNHFNVLVEDIVARPLGETLFRTLVDSIPQMCWMADPEGYIAWYNRRWLDYTSKSLEQMWGQKWAPVLEDNVQSNILQRWLEFVASALPFEMVIPIKGRDGVLRPFLTRAEPVKDDSGRVVQWFGTNTDISVLKQAEAALEERERTHRIVADNTYDFEFWRAPDGCYLYVSPSCERVCGYKPADFIGDPSLLDRLVHPDDRFGFGERMQSLLASPTAVEFEFRIVHRDGTVRWLAKACQPVYGEQGEYLGLRGSNRDITERKKVERALLEADRRKDEFLATLAHELRNPLAPIRNALQILQLSNDPEVLEQLRAVMQRQLDQVVRLVDDLLDVSRISTGKLELRKEQVKLKDIVNAAAEASRPLIDRMGHTLSVTIPKQTLTVDADPARLGQVFVNLLNNAAKYMDREGRIWLTVERQGSDVLVSVKDTGVGIAPDQVTCIFQMFSQVGSSLERSQGGLGIGLTLVKRLVELHGGRIEAQSAGLGKGSEFVVRLPLVVEASGPLAASEVDARTAKSSLRILIVDDNRDSADSLGILLRIMGNDIRTAHDGAKGVELAAEFRPDVVLMDIGLPKMNGYEACQAIREQEWGRKMVLIAVTGWGQDEDRRRSHEAGFDHHMVKPVAPQPLMKLLSDMQAVKT